MKTKLAEIAEVRLGYQFRKKIEPADDGTHWVIQIRDFDQDRVLRKEDLSRVRINEPHEQFLINRGDVLFLSRGHRNWAAPILEDLKDVIAVSHFFILRIKDTRVDPEYLAWYINQTPVQEYLRSNARRGTHMPLITLAAFKELIVDVTDMTTQHRIVELNRLVETEKRLMTKLQEKRSHFINALCLKASKDKKEKTR